MGSILKPEEIVFLKKVRGKKKAIGKNDLLPSQSRSRKLKSLHWIQEIKMREATWV